MTNFGATAHRICAIGRDFWQRGWTLGTSGNFSAVLQLAPLQLAVTASGLDKGALAVEHVLTIDRDGAVVGGDGTRRPSAEVALHLRLVEVAGAGAVLHTHSVWATVASRRHAAAGGVAIEGLEMLKGLAGVTTHAHREWLPIIDNDQDYTALSDALGAALVASPGAHGALLQGHGLYTWGRDLDEARRHVEVLEFLLEVDGRTPR